MSVSEENWKRWHEFNHNYGSKDWEESWTAGIKEVDEGLTKSIEQWGEYQGDCWECLVLCMRFCFWAIK